MRSELRGREHDEGSRRPKIPQSQTLNLKSQPPKRRRSELRGREHDEGSRRGKMGRLCSEIRQGGRGGKRCSEDGGCDHQDWAEYGTGIQSRYSRSRV
jgi:hypothetical protein